MELPWLEKADSVAALGVAVIVIRVCFKLGKRSVHDLIDAVPPDLQEQIHSLTNGNPGIVAVKKVRVRSSGSDLFGDITVTVAWDMGIEKSFGCG